MASGRSWLFRLIALVALLVVFALGWLVGTAGIGRAAPPASLKELERKFTDQLHGASLVGRFTITGRDDRQASPDRYDISSVEKLAGNDWRFNARIRYG